jgi:hypothetical protein
MGKEMRVQKEQHLIQIQVLDFQADTSGLDDDGWLYCYHLEHQLMHIYQVEEDY